MKVSRIIGATISLALSFALAACSGMSSDISAPAPVSATAATSPTPIPIFSLPLGSTPGPSDILVGGQSGIAKKFTIGSLSSALGIPGISGQIWSGNQDFTGANITVAPQSIANSSNAAASTSFVQALVAEFATPRAVLAATSGALPNSPVYNNQSSGVGATLTAGLSGALVVDGYTANVGDRILVKNQASAFQNGVYVVTATGGSITPYVLTRSSDFNAPININHSDSIPVANGSTNGLTEWLETALVSTMGSSSVSFSQISGGGGGGGGTCGSGSVACLNTPQTWTAGQASAPVSVSLSGSTFTPDMHAANNFSVALVHGTCAPCQIANPLNLTAGQTGVLIVKQSATGSDTVTWGGAFAFPFGPAPVLQTGGGTEDIFSYYVESPSKIVIAAGGGANLNGASNGQLLYDNSGVIGGFTPSGDVAINPSTGATTISALPLSKLASIAADNLVGNPTGSSAAPTNIPLVNCATALAYSTTTHSFSCPATSGGGSLVGVQRITTAGSYTYTADPGTNSVIVEVLGAGGGGAGVPSPSGSLVNTSAGGAAGAWCRVRLTANFNGATGSVGALGTGGAAGSTSGNNGGNTTFITTGGSPTTYTAGGGGAGTFHGTGSAPFVGNWTVGGTCSVSPSGNFDDPVQGGQSLPGWSISNGLNIGGTGGSSRYGAGGSTTFSGFNAASAGNAGTGFGSGGSGAVAAGAGAASAGGNGTGGEVIIWEYNFLLRRDLGKPANDNSPVVFLDEVV